MFSPGQWGAGRRPRKRRGTVDDDHPVPLALGFNNTPRLIDSENRHCHHSSIDFLFLLVQVDMGPIVDQNTMKNKQKLKYQDRSKSP